MRYDDETQNPRLARDSKPASAGRVRKLEERVTALEKRLELLEDKPEEPREPLQYSEW